MAQKAKLIRFVVFVIIFLFASCLNPGLTEAQAATGPDRPSAPDLSCYTLTLHYTGYGSMPTVSPTHSLSCPEGTYGLNALVTIYAYPAPGASVKGWWLGGYPDGSHMNVNTMNVWGNSDAWVYYIGGAPCHTLSLHHAGDGADPTTTLPSYYSYCAPGTYSPGESVEVRAHPYSGASFNHWEGTGAPGSGEGIVDPYSAVTFYDMPTTNATVVVYYAGVTNCHTLTLSHTGSGGDPVERAPNPTCPAGTASPGEMVILDASPSTGASVASWTGTGYDQSTSLTNTLNMPSVATAVSVHYTGGTCYPLTLTHTGDGADPSAAPANSDGCNPGTYVSLEPITLTAAPGDGYHTGSWTGTANDASLSNTNKLVMPAGAGTAAANYVANPPCYTLTRTHTGAGNDPTASPTNSDYCPAGQYAAGASIRLTASPATGNHLDGWTGADNDSLKTLANTLTMPAQDQTVTAHYVADPPCNPLTLAHTGSGNNPSAQPYYSTYCVSGNYSPGEVITLAALPYLDSHLASWSGTDNDTSTALTNTLTMPASAATVTVNYIEDCRVLTLSRTGQGSYPTASPAKSSGCSSGKYTPGEKITLTASPATAYAVGSWTGSDDDTSTSLTNTLTMPASAATVTVNYVPACYTLTLAHMGSGSDPTASPDSSTGCPAGKYHSQEYILFTAAPGPGYKLGSWTGTDAVNAAYLHMPAKDTTVTANYVTDCYVLTTSATGTGSYPVPTPDRSNGCNIWNYMMGEVISFTATPDQNYHIGSWSGTDKDDSTAATNTLTMPGHAVTVKVNYVANCYVLTLAHTGEGADPTASPANSTDCPAGGYHYQEYITLTANPGTGHRLGSWTNTYGYNPYFYMPANDVTVTANYVPACYTLTTSSTGNGYLPTANPRNSTGCSVDTYTMGEVITLTASPDTGYVVTGWSGTDNDASTAITNQLTMPASDKTVTVIYGLGCFKLTLAHTGGGEDPTASPANSDGCPAGQYHYNQYITLTAAPGTGYQLKDWTNTYYSWDAYLYMPAKDVTVTANYVLACYTLTLNYTGSGSAPTATWNHTSDDCIYSSDHKMGDVITLTAHPGTGYKVESWSGTDDDTSTANTNTLTMPAKAITVSVAYVADCYTLTLTHTGEGSDPTASPANSTGCPAGQYHYQQDITLTAAPGTGYELKDWINTNYSWDAHLYMPASPVTVTANYVLSCFNLTLNYTGTGSTPSANGDTSNGCYYGQHKMGEVIHLTANPGTGYKLASWSGTDDDTSTANTNTLTMPGHAATVTAAYTAECYALTLTHTGHGADPTASPASSTGCPAGQYHYDTYITLMAAPDTGYSVGAWTGTNGIYAAFLNMPANATTVSVSYVVPCYRLTLSSTGGADSGSSPTASPARSTECATNGSYKVGEVIQLSAAPAPGYVVQSWSGTDADSSTATTNTLTMPASDRAVSVAYAPACSKLTLAHSGSGSDPAASPQNSTGCPAGQYRIGEIIQISATPATHFHVSAWSGTDDDASTAASNQLTMPAGAHTVIVTYAADAGCYTLTLAHTGSGGDPAASPTNSTGCSLGQYTPGQSISLTAAPAVNNRVASWVGTDQDASTSTTNMLTMPASGHTVTVQYEAVTPPGEHKSYIPMVMK